MPGEIDPVAHNRAAWDKRVAEGNEWTLPVDSEVISRARSGDWSVVLIGYEPVPRDWFPPDMHGIDLLGLASGGGQQGPVLAAAGANVVIFDNSPRQLEQDAAVAARDGLPLRTVLGNMQDLSQFPNASFDVVFHPVSNLFCPDIRTVWRECFRVLRPSGLLLVGFVNPDTFIFDYESEQKGELIVRHSIPYSDLTSITPEERVRALGKDAPIEYSHTMTDQVGGQLDAGFVLTHFCEAPHHSAISARYMPGYFSTRAVKPTSEV